MQCLLDIASTLNPNAGPLGSNLIHTNSADDITITLEWKLFVFFFIAQFQPQLPILDSTRLGFCYFPLWLSKVLCWARAWQPETAVASWLDHGVGLCWSHPLANQWQGGTDAARERLALSLSEFIPKAFGSGLCAGQSSSSAPDLLLRVFADLAVWNVLQRKSVTHHSRAHVSAALGSSGSMWSTAAANALHGT